MRLCAWGPRHLRSDTHGHIDDADSSVFFIAATDNMTDNIRIIAFTGSEKGAQHVEEGCKQKSVVLSAIPRMCITGMGCLQSAPSFRLVLLDHHVDMIASRRIRTDIKHITLFLGVYSCPPMRWPGAVSDEPLYPKFVACRGNRHQGRAWPPIASSPSP